MRNNITIKKNRKENGIRALSLGSKPHSNGLDFSRDLTNFLRLVQAVHKAVNPISAPKIINLLIIIDPKFLKTNKY